MKLKVEVPINTSREEIWKVISDIENCEKFISGIEKVEIHEKPEKGLLGLKWTETRTLFGKTATETMWITEEKENEYYQTRAESHGAIYTSWMRILEKEGQLFLEMKFQSEALTFKAKVLSFIFAPLFKGATKKALLQDLLDIKKAVEG